MTTDQTIVWKGPAQEDEVFAALEKGSKIIVEVHPTDEVAAWRKVLEEGAPGPEVVQGKKARSPLDKEKLKVALQFTALLALTGLLVLAISRGYRIQVKGALTGKLSFDLIPPDKADTADLLATTTLPDFAKLESQLTTLGTGVSRLIPDVQALETQAASLSQMAPAADQSFHQSLSDFSDILGDVIDVAGLLAKIEVLEATFDFSDIAGDLKKIQSKITSLDTQTADLDHEISTLGTVLTQLNPSAEKLSSQLLAVESQIDSSWLPAYKAVPGLFQEAEAANSQEGGKLTGDITKAAGVYTAAVTAIETSVSDMQSAVTSASQSTSPAKAALSRLAGSNSSLSSTRKLLANAEALLQAADGAKTQFDLIAQMVTPLEGILGALNVLVSGDQKADPANPSTKASINQAVNAVLPISKLLDSVDGTLADLQKDVAAAQSATSALTKAGASLGTDAQAVSKTAELTGTAQQTLQKLAGEVAKANAKTGVQLLAAGRPGPARQWTAAALRHAIEVLRQAGNSWLELGRESWSASVGSSQLDGSLEPAGVGCLAPALSLKRLAAAVCAARVAGIYNDPYAA